MGRASAAADFVSVPQELAAGDSSLSVSLSVSSAAASHAAGMASLSLAAVRGDGGARFARIEPLTSSEGSEHEMGTGHNNNRCMRRSSLMR